MKKLFLLILTLIVTFSGALAQLDAGQDTTICKGETIQLNATGGSNYHWTSIPPDPTISNPDISNPTIQPDTTTIYIVESREVGVNMLLNGSFELGNVDFTSDYTYNPVSIWDPGTYAIVDDAGEVHPNFFCSSDHTTGSGDMMCVNGAGTPNVVVWSTTVLNLDQNTEYEFSTWVSSLSPISPALLQFEINDQLLGSPFNASIFPCQWNQFFEVWETGTATSATISIINQNTASNGNDFSLDDISFSNVFYLQDTIIVYVIDPPTSTFELQENICNTDTAIITYTGNGADTALYHWDFDGGVILSGSGQGPYKIQWDTPGDKNLSLWVEHACSSDTSYQSISVNQSPVAVVTADATSIPFGTFTSLHGELSGNPGPLSFNWMPEDKLKNPLTQDPETINLESSTLFTFSVLDESSQCSASDSIFIEVTGGALSIMSFSATPDTICEGENTLLAVDIEGGSGNYTTTWSSDPPGFNHTGQELELSVFPDTTTTYFVTADDGFNTTPLSQLKVIVHFQTIVTSQPEDQASMQGETVVFEVSNQYANQYQWQLSKNGGASWEDINNDGNFIGADTQQFTILETTEEMNGWLFRCLLSGNCDPATSDEASLSIITAAAIVNDLSNIESCEQTAFYIEYMVTNFLNIVDFSLSLQYDDQQLSFDALSEIAPELEQNLIVTSANGELLISWNSATEVSLDDGLAFKIGFKSVLSGETLVSWEEQSCSITNVDGYSPQLIFTNSQIKINPLAIEPDIALAEPDSVGILDETEIKLWVEGGIGEELVWTKENCEGEMMGEGNPLFISKPEQTETYFAKWTNACGDSECKEVQVKVLGEFDIYSPTAFSPNGDGINDVFMLVSPADIPEFHLQVYNRWGQIIFESYDVFMGWDGKFKGKPSPAGTYVWKAVFQLRREGQGSEEQVQSGTCILIK